MKKIIEHFTNLIWNYFTFSYRHNHFVLLCLSTQFHNPPEVFIDRFTLSVCACWSWPLFRAFYIFFSFLSWRWDNTFGNHRLSAANNPPLLSLIWTTKLKLPTEILYTNCSFCWMFKQPHFTVLIKFFVRFALELFLYLWI